MSGRLIPRGRTRVEHRAGNSRFLATIGPAPSVKVARAFLHAIREEMPDATHHVHAFRVGHGASITEGMSDDGEPAGTSGPPALAVLRGSGLGDVALVITRYFGGTKLGTGGLVAAYGDAAKAAVAAVETEEKITRVAMELTVPYPHLEGVKRLLAAQGGRVVREGFEADVTLRVQVPEESVASLRERLGDLSSGQIEMTRPGD